MSKTQKMLINNYNKIRNITRTVYLYGIYNNRQMYPVSDRKLSNEKLRIKHLYKNHYKSEFYNNKKYIRIEIKCVDNLTNLLLLKLYSIFFNGINTISITNIIILILTVKNIPLTNTNKVTKICGVIFNHNNSLILYER